MKWMKCTAATYSIDKSNGHNIHQRTETNDYYNQFLPVSSSKRDKTETYYLEKHSKAVKIQIKARK